MHSEEQGVEQGRLERQFEFLREADRPLSLAP
jgi:hypothetical protein